MRGNNIIVMCVASGLATSPYCAYHCRPPGLLVNTETWFVSGLTGGEGGEAVRFATIVCAGLSLIIGLLLKQVCHSVEKNGDFKLNLFRTPLAAAILAPAGIGTLLFVAYNPPPQIFLEPEWPDFYFDHLRVFFLLVGAIGAVLTGLLNDRERAFDKSPIYIKVGILTWYPIAIIVGLVLMAGMIGYGLWFGNSIGRSCGCPITGAWTVGWLAVVALAFEGGIFWPIYFPMTNCANE